MAQLEPVKNPSAAPGYTMDLTPVNAGQAATVRRGISLRPGRTMLVRDEWQAGDHAALVSWQWLTLAGIEITPEGATLTQNGESLHLRATASGGAHFAVEALPESPNTWDGPNPGLSRLTIRVSTAAHEKSWLTEVAGAPDDLKTALPEPLSTLPLTEW